MIRFSISLLLCTAAYAQYYGPRETSTPYPMDFNDPISYKDTRIQPSSNFFFNFEQARRDQPLQVETREENLGKYMGRPRTTPRVPMMTKHLEQNVPSMETVHLHHLNDVKPVSMKPYVPQQWDPINSHLPATLPPAPTTPRWMDLSDDVFKHHTHHRTSTTSRYPMNAYEQVPTQAPPSQWPPAVPSFADAQPQAPPSPSQWPPAVPSFAETQPQQETSYANMMPQYVPPVATHSMPTEQFDRKPARNRSTSRGSHKFNWNDVQATEQAPVYPSASTAAPAPVAPQNRGPPPSIPTLSPWHDGFGK